MLQHLLTDLDSAQETMQKGGFNFLLFGRELRLGWWDRRAVQLGGVEEPSDEITVYPQRQRLSAQQGLELSSPGSGHAAQIACFLQIDQSCLFFTEAYASYRHH